MRADKLASPACCAARISGDRRGAFCQSTVFRASGLSCSTSWPPPWSSAHFSATASFVSRWQGPRSARSASGCEPSSSRASTWRSTSAPTSRGTSPKTRGSASRARYGSSPWAASSSGCGRSTCSSSTRTRADAAGHHNRIASSAILNSMDENGVPITLTAERGGKSPREVVDHWYAHMKETFQRFGIGFDNFSRTSTELHAQNTQLFYRKLKEGGYISEAQSKQMYSPTEGRFLPDRYVEGTCPVCGYKEARGDQCDNCGSWYEAYELIEPHSKVTGGPVEVRETTHLYLDLPEFSERLREWVGGQEHWRTSVKNFILGIIDGGLEKRPITRDIQWGVPVPEPGFEDKRCYVWFDACIGYVSSTMEWAENVGEPDSWREYWQEPETKLIHFIGKDNTVFHTLIWPAQLMGTAEDGEEPFVLPYDVPANEFMNLEVLVDGERRAMQMSTSRNLAVWLDEALKRFPADHLRFYLASNLPETGDVVFSWLDFQSRVNSDLIGNLGNYINRVLSFAEKYFDGEIPRPEELPDEALDVLEDFRALEARYEAKML